MAYQEQSKVEDFDSLAVEMFSLRDIPSKVKPLYCALLVRSKDGAEVIEEVAAFLAAQLGFARSTFYEHLDILIHFGLVGRQEQRASYKWSAPSKLTVQPLRLVKRIVAHSAAGYHRWRRRLAWLRRERRAEKGRKSGCPDIRTQMKDQDYSLSLGVANGFERRQRQAALQSGWITQAQMDEIPDRCFGLESKAEGIGVRQFERLGGQYVR